MENTKKRVLFLCTHNSARSQMAEGLLRAMYGNKYEAYSAGSEVTRVNPYVFKSMGEIGIDLSAHTSKLTDKFIDMEIDYVVTVCDNAKGACPFFPNAKQYYHHSFPDPSAFTGTEEEILKQVSQVREQIKIWIVENFG